MGMTLPEILESHRMMRPVVMGVLNVTPDSFSDGGQFLDATSARARAAQMVRQGADIIDVGAESTRPGAEPVGADEQIARLRDVLPEAVGLGVPVSIDTTSAAVARFALDAGAAIINDVTAGLDDPQMLPLVASRGAAVVLMHMQGRPRTMQADPRYKDVVEEVAGFLAGRLAAAVAAGVSAERCILDPGIGFGKRLEHNLAILAGVERLMRLGRPLLIGPSRKRFIGELTGQSSPAMRVSGTVAACLEAYRRGATIFRVHDVDAVASALAVATAIRRARPGTES
jgi:dihydropteroate synthase